MSISDFDQFTEYVTADGVFPVALDQHSLESPFSLSAVIRGYIRRAELGRAVLEGSAELALVFSEWSPETGFPDHPGVVELAILKGWTAKSVAVGYVIATSAVLDAINVSRTVAIALIRCAIPVSNGPHPLAPSEPFTAGQVSILSTWINEHDITNTEFAALFDTTAALLAAWLQGHPRWQFAAQLHERFT